MEAYTSFAEVYDTFMDNVPYEEWGGYIHRMLCENNINDGILLDLGCGTGTMTELFAGFGYDMIGVDNSADMLEIAMEKKEASGHDILYLLQDMRAFELYGTVRAVLSVCESVNYMTDPADLLRVFRLVNNYLDPGGIFIFDFTLTYNFRCQMYVQNLTVSPGFTENSFSPLQLRSHSHISLAVGLYTILDCGEVEYSSAL